MWSSTCGTNTVNVRVSLAVKSPYSGVHTSKSDTGTINMMSYCYTPTVSCFYITHTTPTMWVKMIHISGDNILLVCLISSGCSASTLWLF